MNHLIEGMFLAIGLRIGIFISVFGADIWKAIVVSLIQPLLMLSTFVFVGLYPVPSHAGIGFGITLIALGIAWAIIVDRSGRPYVKSTFGILQAFLAAWTEDKAEQMEEITESKAHLESVKTGMLKFNIQNNIEISLILPDVHPGPVHPIGGSNLPYILYRKVKTKAVIMHSISDHSLNIPSKKEVNHYLESLSSAQIYEKGNTCSIPIKVHQGNCTVAGVAFGNTALITLSMAPLGMEDIPDQIRHQIENYSQKIGIKNVLIVDSHNAMGEKLSDLDSNDILSAAKKVLAKLKTIPQNEFTIGFSNLDDIGIKDPLMQDIGHSGLATIAIQTLGKQFVIVWADSNNMENGLRDRIISDLASQEIEVLEVCTSDTHETSGKRNRHGYYTFGNLSDHGKVSDLCLKLARNAIQTASKATFDLLITNSKVKVMGKRQFDEYSTALDRSMRITKIFLAITMLTFVIMLIAS
jgi:putative membrane protein